MSKDQIYKVLFVDDEPNLLSGIKRQLRSTFRVYTAESGAKGLETIREHGPFPVVVSDMRMPQMDGAQFLAHVRTQSPKTVRILLTGQTDIESAVSAINEGQIFRFLLKPCPSEALISILNSAIEQYRLVLAEKELLEKTLRGSIKVLTDILSLVNPVAFGRSSRSRRYVNHLAAKLSLPALWQYDLAAMLSQIGCVTVPSDILSKVYAKQELSDKEQQLFGAHPKIGQDLISKIPRLRTVSNIIEQQQVKSGDFLGTALSELPIEVLGGHILNVALALDQRVSSGERVKVALQYLAKEGEVYHPELLQLLEDIPDVHGEDMCKTVTANELNMLMVIDEDIYATNGALIVSKGQEVTEAMIARLKMMADNEALKEPFRVIVHSG